MSYGDAVRILAARKHLADLEAALRIVGFRLEQGVLHEHAEPEAQLVVDADPATAEPDDVDESSDARLIPRDHLWDDSIADSSSEKGIAWDWGNTPSVAASARTVGRNGGLVPYVLPSVEIPQVSRDTQAGSIERPRTAEEYASLLRKQVVEYAAAWDTRRIRDLLLRKVPGRRIDVPKVVRLLAARKPVRTLPLMSRSRVALPIQIVHDIGLFTGPLSLDLQALIDAMLTHGNSGLDRISFRHTLSAGCGSGPVWEWEDYRLPRRATAVVLISGLYGPDPARRVGEFEQLLATLNRHGHHARAVWFGALPDRAILRRPEQWVVCDQ
ncbi:hypothetical protein [Streptomyces rubrogriseus]|uniref:hypothetical protein n=1 Tax=Streptomyces rubrogriseus TaxID=194673 RepID=UPI0037D79A77